MLNHCMTLNSVAEYINIMNTYAEDKGWTFTRIAGHDEEVDLAPSFHVNLNANQAQEVLRLVWEIDLPRVL